MGSIPDPSRRKHRERGRGGLFDSLDASARRSARRDKIVHQYDISISGKIGALEPESLSHILGPPAGIDLRLALRVSEPLQHPGLHFEPEHLGNFPRKKGSLVVSPRFLPRGMEWNGNKQWIARDAANRGRKVIPQCRRHPPTERRDGGPPAGEFQKTDESEKRIIGQKRRNERNGRGRSIRVHQKAGGASRLELEPALRAENSRRHSHTAKSIKAEIGGKKFARPRRPVKRSHGSGLRIERPELPPTHETRP